MSDNTKSINSLDVVKDKILNNLLKNFIIFLVAFSVFLYIVSLWSSINDYVKVFSLIGALLACAYLSLRLHKFYHIAPYVLSLLFAALIAQVTASFVTENDLRYSLLFLIVALIPLYLYYKKDLLILVILSLTLSLINYIAYVNMPYYLSFALLNALTIGSTALSIKSLQERFKFKVRDFIYSLSFLLIFVSSLSLYIQSFESELYYLYLITLGVNIALILYFKHDLNLNTALFLYFNITTLVAVLLIFLFYYSTYSDLESLAIATTLLGPLYIIFNIFIVVNILNKYNIHTKKSYFSIFIKTFLSLIAAIIILAIILAQSASLLYIATEEIVLILLAILSIIALIVYKKSVDIAFTLPTIALNIYTFISLYIIYSLEHIATFLLLLLPMIFFLKKEYSKYLKLNIFVHTFILVCSSLFIFTKVNFLIHDLSNLKSDIYYFYISKVIFIILPIVLFAFAKKINAKYYKNLYYLATAIFISSIFYSILFSNILYITAFADHDTAYFLDHEYTSLKDEILSYLKTKVEAILFLSSAKALYIMLFYIVFLLLLLYKLREKTAFAFNKGFILSLIVISLFTDINIASLIVLSLLIPLKKILYLALFFIVNNILLSYYSTSISANAIAVILIMIALILFMILKKEYLNFNFESTSFNFSLYKEKYLVCALFFVIAPSILLTYNYFHDFKDSKIAFIKIEPYDPRSVFTGDRVDVVLDIPHVYKYIHTDNLELCHDYKQLNADNKREDYAIQLSSILDNMDYYYFTRPYLNIKMGTGKDYISARYAKILVSRNNRAKIIDLMDAKCQSLTK